jgi:hypothetical protein
LAKGYSCAAKDIEEKIIKKPTRIFIMVKRKYIYTNPKIQKGVPIARSATLKSRLQRHADAQLARHHYFFSLPWFSFPRNPGHPK